MAWTVARSKASAADRMERLILEILAYHKENFVSEQRVNELVVAAIEGSWEAIRAHKQSMQNVAELIVRDGIAAGDFQPVDPRGTAELIMRAVVALTHATPKAERPVQIQAAALGPKDASREFVGVVRARHETDLGFRVAGKIVTRSINVGDTVHAGDVVAQLDPQDLNLQVESAQAELAAATSNLADASAEEARYATLKARAAVAVADYDHKKAAKDEAVGRLERARRTLELASNQLGYAELHVDADRVITATPAEPGQVVALGQAVARLAPQGHQEAPAALPETPPPGAPPSA